MNHRTAQATRLAAVTALAAGVTVGTGMTGPLPASAAPGCAPYVLPGLPGGADQADIISIAAAGIYGGEAIDAYGVDRAAYWTHAGSDLSTGWTIQLVPDDPLVDDFIGAINTHGQMVVTGSDPATGAGVGYVFDLNTQAITMLPGLGGGFDYDRRINDAGVVAGSSLDTHGVLHAVTWSPPYKKANPEPDAGASRSFSSPDAHAKAGATATGINNRGQVVGAGFDGGHLADTQEFARNHFWHDAVHPLLQPIEYQANGSSQRLPTGNGQGDAWAINDAGLVVGNAADAQTFTARPTAWVNGNNVDMGAPADIVFGNAYGLSQGGWAAGGYYESDGSTSRAFTWDSSDGFRTLDPPAPYSNSWSHGVSDVLRQVGGSADDGNTQVAVVWQC
jgi:hypothetical protein